MLLHLQQILAIKNNFAFDTGSALGQKAQDGQSSCCFAGTCFADESQCLSLVKVQVNAVDGVNRFQIGFINDFQIADVKQPFTHVNTSLLVFQLRIERIAQTVADEVKAQSRNQDGETGEVHQVRRSAQVFARVRQHAAPFWARRCDTHTQEG